MKRLLPEIQIDRDGGATFVTLPRHDVPVMCVELWSPGGWGSELRKKPGLTDLTSALLNEGTIGTESAEWRRNLDRHAIGLHVGAAEAHWRARTDALTEDCDLALDHFTRLLSAPALPQSEWKRLVRSHEASASEIWAQPDHVIGHLGSAQVLGSGHPHAATAFPGAFKRISFKDARSGGANAFSRNGAFVLSCGDFDTGIVRARVRELLQRLPVGSGGPAQEPPLRPARHSVWLMDHRKVSQAFFVLTRPGIRRNDPERLALRAANYLLGGGGFSSRLMQNVREKLGHTYGISSSLPEDAFSTPFAIKSFTAVDHLGKVLGVITATLREVVEHGFSTEEVSASAEHFFGALPLRLMSPQSMLHHVFRYLQSGLSLADAETDWLAVRELTRDRVNAAARRVIGDGKFKLAVIGPSARIQPQIKDWGEAAVFHFSTRPDAWPG